LGSRGIDKIADIAAVVVRHIKNRGAVPVVIPAMGSHGGATPAGQVKVLHELGMDERALGAPIDASMDVEEVGRLASGEPVLVSQAALACDHVVLVNRVKPHTDFRAPIESGLTKMLTIGLGKERGASSLHSAGFRAFHKLLPEAASIILQRLPVSFGVALLEDEWHRLRRAELVPASEMLKREVALLKEAWSHFGRLPFASVDVMLLAEMGKTISGAGMDPNVTGRFPDPDITAPTRVQRLVVLDLVEASGGNAIGVGSADVVTERLRGKVDWPVTYVNAIVSRALSNGKLPVVAQNDREALGLALGSLTGLASRAPSVVAMANTLKVDHFVVSGPLVETAREAGWDQVGGPVRPEFGDAGELVRIGGLPFFDGAISP
ncbi:MAG: lactate racemase domain-containing protein, partial [Acidimicrobiales bacterium]